MNRFPPQRILVAFDFTQRSLQAWRYAETLAARFGAELEALHVAAWTVAPDGLFIAPDLTQPERRALTEELDRKLGRPGAGRVAEGDVVSEILARARTAGADMIVMATEGRVGLKRLAFGSLAEAVVRRSPIPVLTLRRPAKAPSSLLAPVNLEEYSMSGFHYAEDLARTLKLPLTLLHVRADQRPVRRLELAADAARRLWGVRARLEVVDGEPVRRIVAEAKRHGLVVMVAHRRGLLRDALLGSTAEQVLRRSPVPVLCVPARVLPSRRKAAPRRGSRAGTFGSRFAARGRPALGWKA